MFIRECYVLVNDFPQEEKFALIQQIRRASKSVHLNLSEGFSGKSAVERKRFFEVSKDSIIEIDGALDAAEDLCDCKKENLQNPGIVMNRFSMLSKLISS